MLDNRSNEKVVGTVCAGESYLGLHEPLCCVTPSVEAKVGCKQAGQVVGICWGQLKEDKCKVSSRVVKLNVQ